MVMSTIKEAKKYKRKVRSEEERAKDFCGEGSKEFFNQGIEDEENNTE